MLAVNQNSDLWDLDITISLVDDLRGSGSNFWSLIQERHYCLLLQWSFTDPLALPEMVEPSNLPTTWDVNAFSDNIWRSLAGFGEHYDDEGSERCYIQTCDYFVDYQWAYVMHVATVTNTSLWPSDSGAASMLKAVQAQPFAPKVAKVDLSAWESLGKQVLTLCRADTIKDYPLPSAFGLPSLKGWHKVPLPANPDCDPAVSVV